MELLRRLNDAGKELSACPVPPAALAELLAKIEKGEITAASGKKVFATMFDTGKRAADIIERSLASRSRSVPTAQDLPLPDKHVTTRTSERGYPEA